MRGHVCRREQCGVHFVSRKLVSVKLVSLKMVSLKLPWPGVRASYMQVRIYARVVRRYSDVSILRYRPQPVVPIRTGEESR